MSKKIVKAQEISQEDQLENEQFEAAAEEMQVDLEIEQDKNPIAKPKVGERCKQLILEGVLDNKGILEQIKKEYPEGKTSIACIAWYKSDLKKKKPVDGYAQWLKDNEAKLRAEYESTLVTV